MEKHTMFLFHSGFFDPLGFSGGLNMYSAQIKSELALLKCMEYKHESL